MYIYYALLPSAPSRLRISNVGGVKPLFLCMLAISINFVTGNGNININYFKWNLAFQFVFSTHSSAFGSSSVAKVSVISTL